MFVRIIVLLRRSNYAKVGRSYETCAAGCAMLDISISAIGEPTALRPVLCKVALVTCFVLKIVLGKHWSVYCVFCYVAV